MKSSPAVLFVDDDRDDQEMFLEVARELRPDLICHFAFDGIEALGLLNSIEKPICIYLDLNMPRMNGIQTLKAVKADKRLATIPVIVLTTSSVARSEKEARDLGAADYMVKPSSYTGVAELLKRCFRIHNL